MERTGKLSEKDQEIAEREEEEGMREAGEASARVEKAEWERNYEEVWERILKDQKTWGKRIVAKMEDWRMKMRTEIKEQLKAEWKEWMRAEWAEWDAHMRAKMEEW